MSQDMIYVKKLIESLRIEASSVNMVLGEGEFNDALRLVCRKFSAAADVLAFLIRQMDKKEARIKELEDQLAAIRNSDLDRGA